MSNSNARLYREGFQSVRGVTGPLLFVNNARGVGYGEFVTIETRSWGSHAWGSHGKQTVTRTGQVLQIQDDLCVIQVFDDILGFETGNTTVWVERDVAKVGVGERLRGQILNGRGQTLEGKDLYGLDALLPINGLSLNPVTRAVPCEPIETGMSVLDLMNTTMRGQRLALLGGPGLPVGELAALVASRALLPGNGDAFLVVFAAMGVTSREVDVFMESFVRSGILESGVFLLNKADDPAIERLLTPRAALTIAEYFAFTKGYDVLVVMTDMLCYAEALREVGAARGESLGRMGYPTYLYSDLAGIYERAGCLAGRKGRVTQIVTVGMPNDDAAHPVADATSHIVDGQIVLDRRLHTAGVFPPVDVLSSLSRPMNKGIGHGRTFDTHRVLADQLHAAYAKAQEVNCLRHHIGDKGLSEVEKSYIKFGESFEKLFVNQKRERGREQWGRETETVERRTFIQSEAKAWEILRQLPAGELYLLSPSLMAHKLK
ncbi:MAG: V-type ATP synthase subunit B [Synergistaceae bacterium]|jgi:V/A-type H+-transporting ATPase subunit B|nr:V-type ATP synthase subunit B [Synergistaceae bacterium]